MWYALSAIREVEIDCSHRLPCDWCCYHKTLCSVVLELVGAGRCDAYNPLKKLPDNSKFDHPANWK